MGNLDLIDSSDGYGTFDLSNANTSGLSGQLIIQGGFVALNDSSELGSGALVFDGGGLRATGALYNPRRQRD